ncbi:MAG TPA: UDP-N-acetylmuramoyl-tripeptide--D-alanyl-D-alanine ligase, partial [Patescibacteria group bacterium]
MKYSQFYPENWKRPYHIIKAKVARIYGQFWDKDVIGITGSVGKTTTKEAIAKVLSYKFKVISSKENLDPVFNIPKTLLRIRPSTQKIVLEYGVEYPNEMDFYLDLAVPKMAVITRIYWTHTQFLKNIFGVGNEKGKLLKALPPDGIAILNFDDEYIRNRMSKLTKAKIFWYGSRPGVDLQISDFLYQGVEGSKFLLKFKDEEIEIKWKLIGEHNTYAAAAAASVGVNCGMKLSEVKVDLEKMERQPHRLTPIKYKDNLIIDDTYNSSPVAAVMAIETLRSFARKSRAIAVLGDMLELGGFENQGHREVGEKLAQENIEVVVTVGEASKIISDTAKSKGIKEAYHLEDNQQVT